MEHSLTAVKDTAVFLLLKNERRSTMYTQNQINRAKNIDLLDYVRQRGYSLIQSAANEYRLKEHDSLVISNNKWKWFSQNIGGDTLDFVTKYEGKSFKDAMEILLGEKGREKLKKYLSCLRKQIITEGYLPTFLKLVKSTYQLYRI